MDVTETSAGNMWEDSKDACYVGLTEGSLDAKAIMDKVRSPAAGAIVLFAGTSRNGPADMMTAAHISQAQRGTTLQGSRSAT